MGVLDGEEEMVFISRVDGARLLQDAAPGWGHLFQHYFVIFLCSSW